MRQEKTSTHHTKASFVSRHINKVKITFLWAVLDKWALLSFTKYCSLQNARMHLVSFLEALLNFKNPKFCQHIIFKGSKFLK